jgi:hypothetical protein
MVSCYDHGVAACDYQFYSLNLDNFVIVRRRWPSVVSSVAAAVLTIVMTAVPAFTNVTIHYPCPAPW